MSQTKFPRLMISQSGSLFLVLKIESVGCVSIPTFNITSEQVSYISQTCLENSYRPSLLDAIKIEAKGLKTFILGFTSAGDPVIVTNFTHSPFILPQYDVNHLGYGWVKRCIFLNKNIIENTNLEIFIAPEEFYIFITNENK